MQLKNLEKKKHTVKDKFNFGSKKLYYIYVKRK